MPAPTAQKVSSEPYRQMNQRLRAFAPTLGLGPPKGASIDRLSGAGASTGVLSSTLGVARRGHSTGCVLDALWAVSAAVLRGGYPVGVSIPSSCHTQVTVTYS